MQIEDNSKMHNFKEFLDACDTSGGHVFICIVVGSFGVALGLLSMWFVWPDKELATLFAGLTGAMTNFFSIAAYAMQGRGRANGKTIIVTSDSTEHTETITPSDKTPSSTSN